MHYFYLHFLNPPQKALYSTTSVCKSLSLFSSKMMSHVKSYTTISFLTALNHFPFTSWSRPSSTFGLNQVSPPSLKHRMVFVAHDQIIIGIFLFFFGYEDESPQPILHNFGIDTC